MPDKKLSGSVDDVMKHTLAFKVELTYEQIRFLVENQINTLFHCCGTGETTSEENEELQSIFESAISGTVHVADMALTFERDVVAAKERNSKSTEILNLPKRC